MKQLLWLFLRQQTPDNSGVSLLKLVFTTSEAQAGAVLSSVRVIPAVRLTCFSGPELDQLTNVLDQVSESRNGRLQAPILS
jgi:hypothetical protein